MKHLPDRTKEYVVNYNTANRALITNAQALLLVNDSNLADLMFLINWRDLRPSYIASIQPLLSRIEAERWPTICGTDRCDLQRKTMHGR